MRWTVTRRRMRKTRNDIRSKRARRLESCTSAKRNIWSSPVKRSEVLYFLCSGPQIVLTTRADLSSFRGTLLDLTAKIDELENLKYAHFRAALDLSQETSARILDCSALVVRAEVEIFEKIASKGWDASGGLDDLISRAADPFAANSSYGNSGDGEIFSILPTESILPSPHGALNQAGSTSGVGGGIATEGKYQSLTGALSQNGDYDECDDDDEDTQSIFSGGFSSPSPSKSQLGLPGFSPSVSSAGWGNINQQTYSLESQLHQLPSHIGEGTETSSNSRASAGRHGGEQWQDQDDGDRSTLRELSINWYWAFFGDANLTWHILVAAF